MRKLLNTLYVTTPNSYLSKDGENIVITVEEKQTFRIPVHNIESIVYFGYLGASPSLIGFCADRGIGISLLSQSGYFLGRISGPVTGNVLTRKKQYRLSDDLFASKRIAEMFITGKIINGRAVLRRAVRDHADRIDVEKIKLAEQSLTSNIKNIGNCKTLDEIRGIEGISANIYFSCLDELILNQKDDFYFKGRSKRPPKDRMNALLSYFYTLLTHDIRCALETVGLDPYVGFLHRDRPGRPSLALDVMEELRPYIADRLALSLVNLRQICAKQFDVQDTGAVMMNRDTRKLILSEWQKRKQDVITHPFINEKIPIGLLPYVQAMLFAKFIRGDLEDYPPFLWK
jgi:CRISPR-associated protein Cas1